MTKVDYSKWDKMASEMSDSEDDMNKPTVTTFDEPQSVTFGGNTESHQAENCGNEPGTDALVSSNEDRTPKPPAVNECAGVKSGGTKRSPVTYEKLVENGGEVVDNNGKLRYIWRQSRTEIVAIISVPLSTRARDTEISLQPKSGTITEGVADLLRVEIKGGDVLVDGELAFQTKLDEDVDWELRDFVRTRGERDLGSLNTQVSNGEGQEKHRGVEVTLRKHCPIPGAAIWWRSFLKGDPEIDVSKIEGRPKNNYQPAWDEAMRMFKAKMADRKGKGKIPVDTGED